MANDPPLQPSARVVHHPNHTSAAGARRPGGAGHEGAPISDAAELLGTLNRELKPSSMQVCACGSSGTGLSAQASDSA